VQNSSGERRSIIGALDAAEDASPVQAVESVTRSLGLALGADAASFLIADLSGRALVRLTHIPLSDGLSGRLVGDPDARQGDRRIGEEAATLIPFDGGPAEQAMRAQAGAPHGSSRRPSRTAPWSSTPRARPTRGS
jgi:hypothetical protein